MSKKQPKASATNTAMVRWSWLLHIFTTTGVLCAMVSVVNILNGLAEQALVWLMLAQVIDGVDGPIARKINVKKHTPVVDGNVLDLVVDFVTCVVVPVIFAVKFDLLPLGAETTITALILMTSAIWFSRKDIETKDLWFRGFPTAWNLVFTVLWLLGTTQIVNAVVSCVFIALTILPQVKFAHILGAPQFRRVTVPFSTVAMLVMVFMTLSNTHRHNQLGKYVIIVWAAYYMCITVWRTLQGDEIEPYASQQ